MPGMRLIRVAAGVIEDREGRVLVTRRPPGVHQGGLWEFPGGKLEQGETPKQGLIRELEEELGIQVRSARPLIRIRHDYGDRRVVLDVYRLKEFVGEPHGREGQPLAWLYPGEMQCERFPAADRPIITALRLPCLCLITGEDPRDPDHFLDRVGRALEGGVRLVQLRAQELTQREYERLGRRVFELCEKYGARLILNREPARVGHLPCHGVHLTGRGLYALRDRRCIDAEWVGASCHGWKDLERAGKLGLDYAFLSPVRHTASHPQTAPLGWERFAELADRAVLPVYALGGLGPEDLGVAFVHGAQGVAAIRGIWPLSDSCR
jgi:8-oxo-dGTP diphosphatase